MVLRSCFLVIAAYYLAPVALGQSLRVETSLGSFEIELLSEFAPPTVATVLPFNTSSRHGKSRFDLKTSVKTDANNKLASTSSVFNMASMDTPKTGSRRFSVDGGDPSAMDPMYAVFGEEQDATASSVIFEPTNLAEEVNHRASNHPFLNHTSKAPELRAEAMTMVAISAGL